MDQDRAWNEARQYTPEQLDLARIILEEVRAGHEVMTAIRRHPQPGGGYIGKHALVHAYRELTLNGDWLFDPEMLRRIRMKPGRTLSGVSTVTVLTKPYPCPGDCIFCPDDARVPKSYLPDEPGAMRGVNHNFDPYDQTASSASMREAVNQDRRNAERYGRTYRVLEDLYKRLDDVRKAVYSAGIKPLSDFVAAVHEQLSLEHRQWLGELGEKRGAFAELEKTLKGLSKKISS